MGSHVQGSDAWIRAQDRYVEDLSEEEQQRYFKASPESLLEDASAAEKSHGMISSTRSVMEKLQPFVAAIEQYGEAVDVYSSTYSIALGPIWGSIKVLLHVSLWGALWLFTMTKIFFLFRSHVSLVNTLTSLWKCLKESAMSYRASKLTKGSSQTTSS